MDVCYLTGTIVSFTYLIDIIISLIFFRACKRIQKIQGFGERFIKTTPFLPGKVSTHFIGKSGNRASSIEHRASGIGHRAASMAGRGYCKI
jgi:hypothetical protein